MKTVRVSKNIMNSLNAKGYAYGAKAGRVGGKSLDYYKGYEQALKDFRRRVDNMQEYGG